MSNQGYSANRKLNNRHYNWSYKMDFFDKIDNTLWAIKTVPIYFSLQLVLEVRLNYVEIVLKNSATLSPRALS